MAALSFSFAALTQNEVTQAEFVQADRDNIFDAGDELTASAIADVVISRRATLDKAMARNRLASAVLPSLAQFDVTVDLRIIGFLSGSRLSNDFYSNNHGRSSVRIDPLPEQP